MLLKVVSTAILMTEREPVYANGDVSTRSDNVVVIVIAEVDGSLPGTGESVAFMSWSRAGLWVEPEVVAAFRDSLTIGSLPCSNERVSIFGDNPNIA